jgi:hypothetical protein
MADKVLDEVIDEAVADENVRKVEIEITHKHDDTKSTTTWAIALVVVLVIAGALVYAADSVKDFVGGDDGVIGDCADGVDNDGDQVKDAQDPGCRPNGQYDPESYENLG